MDIQHLVDRLEDLIDEGRHIPMSKFTLIDEERALGIIDQMRISVPEQIETAARVVGQRDRLVAQANEEASRIIDNAKRKSDEMTTRDSIVVAAQHQARHMVEQAEAEAIRVREEADNYVVEVLRDLEGQLLRTLTVVRNGINKVIQEQEGRRVVPLAEQPQEQQQPTSIPIPKRESVDVEQDN